jgi:hypothetical protein
MVLLKSLNTIQFIDTGQVTWRVVWNWIQLDPPLRL